MQNMFSNVPGAPASRRHASWKLVVPVLAALVLAACATEPYEPFTVHTNAAADAAVYRADLAECQRVAGLYRQQLSVSRITQAGINGAGSNAAALAAGPVGAAVVGVGAGASAVNEGIAENGNKQATTDKVTAVCMHNKWLVHVIRGTEPYDIDDPNL